MYNRNIIIIGAGASGMMAAIIAARNHAKVTILEHTDRLGKKLLVTGNGRCNLTNLVQPFDCYRSNNQEFPKHIVEQFGAEQTLKLFEEMGLYTKNKNGYVYPYSEQASTVQDILNMELDHLGVKIDYSIIVNKIIPEGNKFKICTNAENYICDNVIIAAGSKAAPKTGSDGSGYEIAKSLGHSIIKPLPALVQLRCEGNYFKRLSGIRCEVMIHLFINGKESVSDRGELQLTDYGISGIPTFQISRYAVKALDEGKEVLINIDFLPDMELSKLNIFMQKQMNLAVNKNLEQFLIGFLNKKLVPIIIKRASLSPQVLCKNIAVNQLNSLLTCIKKFKVKVISFNSFEQAQVCSGGVNTKEISKTTLESLKAPGVYFAGEILDVDGICGGYNLQWAWSSGFVAGLNASNRLIRKCEKP
jgi:predicted Rossmann fold flavoprotein